MTWEFRETKEFEKQYDKLPLEIKRKFENQFRKVELNPYAIGKPLGYTWFRELKNGKFRVYYLVYDHKVLVLFVGISDKKTQQETISIIKQNLEMFKSFVESKEKKI